MSSDMRKRIGYVILSLLSCSQIWAQGNWALAKEKHGIQVYVRELPDSEYHAFQAVMSVPASPKEILTILRTVEQYPDWFAYTASTRLLAQTSHEQTFFMETDYPWPFSNECLNYHMQFEQAGETWTITISQMEEPTDCEYALKQAGGYIRLEPDGEHTLIRYYFHSEPSQSIPPWLINPRIHEMPYQTFLALKDQLHP